MAIGNHTWSHPDLTTLSDAEVADQLTRNQDVPAHHPGRAGDAVLPAAVRLARRAGRPDRRRPRAPDRRPLVRHARRRPGGHRRELMAAARQWFTGAADRRSGTPTTRRSPPLRDQLIELIAEPRTAHGHPRRRLGPSAAPVTRGPTCAGRRRRPAGRPGLGRLSESIERRDGGVHGRDRVAEGAASPWSPGAPAGSGGPRAWRWPRPARTWRSPTSTPPGSEQTRAMVADAGGSADVVALDVTDDESRRSVVAGLFDRHGDAFDILVNVAGIDRPGYITDIDLADYRQVQAVNCEGPVFLTSEFMKRVQHLPEGRTADVVHIVSLSAITSGSGAIAYNGSKAGFRNATRCIQRELREKAVRLPDGSERPFPCRVHEHHPRGDGHADDGAVGHPGAPDDAAVGRGRDGAHAGDCCTRRASCPSCRSCRGSSPTSPDEPRAGDRDEHPATTTPTTDLPTAPWPPAPTPASRVSTSARRRCARRAAPARGAGAGRHRPRAPRRRGLGGRRCAPPRTRGRCPPHGGPQDDGLRRALQRSGRADDPSADRSGAHQARRAPKVQRRGRQTRPGRRRRLRGRG